MTSSDAVAVAVYIDFDNVVISRTQQAQKETFRRATLDLDAILDFASSYGTVRLSRAYADWSRPGNADYRDQLISRAVDLVQLFQTTRSMKNGADIRLAIDVVEDLFRLDDVSHVVIVAGDSDYVPLAQRARRLGRTVIGIGVAGSISRALASACDEYHDYDTLPGIDDEPPLQVPPEEAPARDVPTVAVSSTRATRLLIRAIRLLQSQQDQEWQEYAAVKNQMLRMEPRFQESALGFASFSKFLESRGGLIQLKDGQVHLRSAAAKVPD